MATATLQLVAAMLGLPRQGERYDEPPTPVSSDEIAAFRDSLLPTGVQGRNAAIEQKCASRRRAYRRTIVEG